MRFKSPFPYFGGKSKVVDKVWQALGRPNHYIEPFFGSGAVLLARPGWYPRMIETVNDADGLLCNVWRSLQFSPDEVARWCDWPVNHADLMARKAALLKNEGRLMVGLTVDDHWHDPVMAGYWVWAASCWIGGGLTRPGQSPDIGKGGKGVHSLYLRPDTGKGGKEVQDPYKANLYAWFRQLSERLRYVRVVCGDWSRVCGGNWQDACGDVGIFMDPPYSGGIGRGEDLYHKESLTVAAEVREWCLERGEIPTYRIVLAGYFEEHETLLSHGWRVYRWTTQGGYGNLARNGRRGNPGKQNRDREALFFSPHCMDSHMRGFFS